MEQAENLKNNTKDSLSQDIREAIDCYLREEDLTLQEFADRVGMSLRNIKDIVNNGRIPYVRNTISIFKVILKKETIGEILKEVKPSVGSYIRESKFYLENEILEDDSKIMLEYENNPSFALVYDLTVDSGVSSSEIHQKFGEYGLSMAIQLIKYGLIKKEGEYYVRTSKRLFRSTKAIECRFLNSYKMFLRSESLNCTGENILRNFGADLTEEQYNRWLQILADAYVAIESISSEQTSEPKTIKAFTGIFADVMINRMESINEN